MKTMYQHLEIESLWRQLGDISIDDNECIEQDFHIWKKGTERIEIWYWFDEMYKEGVYKLMFSEKMVI